MKNAVLRTIVYTLAVGLSVGTMASRTVSAGEFFADTQTIEEREFSLYCGAALSLGEDIEAESGLPVCGAALAMGEDLTVETVPYVSSAEVAEEEPEEAAEQEESNAPEEAEQSVQEAPVVQMAENAAPAVTEEPVAQAPVTEQETPAAAAEEDATEAAPEEEAAEPATEPVAEAEEIPEQAEEEVPSDNGDIAMGQQVADFACQFIGGPYKYGGSSLTGGADCSGFVMAVYANFGISLPHSSTADRGVGRHVDGGLTGAIPGDIICYNGHVGIYIGNGLIVHAFNSRKGIVTTNADYDTVLEVRRIF